jgi:glycosyltransferase involved in cell wall biosynthesis
VRTVPRGHGHLWEQTRLPRACKGGLISLCNVGPVAKRRHIVCIHDLNTQLAPESYGFRFRLLYRALLPALGRSAELVTTVSQFSATQLVRLGICGPDKIRIIPDGHEHALRFAPEHSAATKAAAGRNTIVLLGSPAPHKNVGTILSMAGDLEAMGLRIALVGSADPRIFRTQRQPAAENVVWLGAVDDNALAALLEDSLCLAFPSLTEGFGLPALEAMALGCPVVASDRASLPEVCGSAALFAAPTDRALWLRHFQTLAHDEKVRADLVARGRLQAARFRWSDSALSYLDAMARIDARRA